MKFWYQAENINTLKIKQLEIFVFGQKLHYYAVYIKISFLIINFGFVVSYNYLFAEEIYILKNLDKGKKTK